MIASIGEQQQQLFDSPTDAARGIHHREIRPTTTAAAAQGMGLHNRFKTENLSQFQFFAVVRRCRCLPPLLRTLCLQRCELWCRSVFAVAVVVVAFMWFVHSAADICYKQQQQQQHLDSRQKKKPPLRSFRTIQGTGLSNKPNMYTAYKKTKVQLLLHPKKFNRSILLYS